VTYYLWQLRPYFRQVLGQLIIGSIAGIIMNTMVVLPSILLGRAIDTALDVEKGTATLDALGWAALAFIGGTLLTEGPRIGKRWWLITANARIRANLRADAMRGVLAWPMERLHCMPIGDLMARLIGDVETLGVSVREFTIEIWDTVLFSISFMVAMFIYDPMLTVVALLPVPFAMWLAQVAGQSVRLRVTRGREANASLTAALQEQLAGIRVVRLFGRMAAMGERIAVRSRRLMDANLATVRLRDGLRPVYMTIMIAGIVPVVWLGGQRVISGAMTVGAFVAYLQLFLRFINRGFRVPQLINAVQSGAGVYGRLHPLLAGALPVGGEPAWASFRTGHVAGIIQPVPPLPPAPAGPVAVLLDHVRLHYPDNTTPALDDVSLDIAPGWLVVVTGPIGSGKSALARAILGSYPIEHGAVRLNGRKLDEIPPAERAAMTGYLPQEPLLFSGSIRENILFNNDSENARLSTATACAALNDDLQTFSAHLETEIGELGVRVSGGQRQRIALARALAATPAHTPGLLVLDDPFSAVDLATEATIIESLRQAFGAQAPREQQATIVLCTHRLAVCPFADCIVVLDRGRIVEQGTHTELLAAHSLYARIYSAQTRVAAVGDVR
jgi:ATP-binding cassette subfamily B protein